MSPKQETLPRDRKAFASVAVSPPLYKGRRETGTRGVPWSRDSWGVMRLSDRLTRMIDGVPEGGAIMLPVDSVREWLSENGSGLDHDFTVEDIAAFFNRSPVTIRTWIRKGRLEAYHFRGNEYRITNAALEEFQSQERSGKQSRTQ